MNFDQDLSSVLAVAAEIYRRQGTLGVHADAFNRLFAEHRKEAVQHATVCNELYDAVCRASEGDLFGAYDYMVYFNLAFHLRKIDLIVILRSLGEAVRLSTRPEFGLAWDLILTAAAALSIFRQQPSDDAGIRLNLHFGQLFATVMTRAIPESREHELSGNIAGVLSELPPYMAIAICSATARGLREGLPRYDVLAVVAHQVLSEHLSPAERVNFIVVHWLPTIDASTASQEVLNQAMTSAIVAIEDARPAGEEVDVLLRLLRGELAKYPLRARLEYMRHIVRLASELSASRTALAMAYIQHAHWLGSIAPTVAAQILRRARELWPPEELPRDIEVQALLLEAALAFQRGGHDEALRLSDLTVERASGLPELLAVAESRRNTHRMMLGVHTEPLVATNDPNYMEHVSRLFAEASVEFRHDRLQRCVDLLEEALALPKPAAASAARYTRRRAYLLRAAAQPSAGNLEESLRSVLDAIDELTEDIRRHISGTEQVARRHRFAEVEALLDRGLQIVSQDPLAFSWACFERLWAFLIQYRDIELEFNDNIVTIYHDGNQDHVAEYRQTRDLLSVLELDGGARPAEHSADDAAAQYARQTSTVRHSLYNIEITLSEMPTYAESVRRRMDIRLADIVATLQADEMLVEFVDFWSGMEANGVGVRALMALTISATEPQQIIVISDRRVCPPRKVVIQALLDLDRQPSESVDLPVSEPDLARALIRQAQATQARRLLSVPDGPIKLMNLAGFPYADTRLADHLDIVYLGHAADLLLSPPPTPAGLSAVFGDADFDAPLSDSQDACASDGPPPLQFPDLPATATEANWVSGSQAYIAEPA